MMDFVFKMMDFVFNMMNFVKVIDFKHITDVITPEAALALLKAKRPGWSVRKFLLFLD